ncbi:MULTISPECIES: phosphoribosylglycinamide formyltransferase [unclassified Roseofilum]|uniref:phosphoribosylglycinamide formyltransferase n=1 Tax=unclassified Roseofilum TaxID=2620099 RepID=UPI000E8E15E1|nr:MULTISPECIES: phosphoribosylglycinamide formyltransferase [unclassified Roseofilum]HBQ98429.1 phosphoribosylglycinamide formyltransferase [Cyanobacteria bacterium UBA11691]MBP0006966.1 phosphoribosylglycinamide formyltransferase [Roseofilum sp. Belize Diploria]MBP0013471.1 phosphoribosylglycinamide formyltransferase [Roseofilum sp. SID3]MBP0024668.1 phosphoribosylglycinamide formyltransferase [Roseofilum sp. SID2]MBP0032873.1 phosphoribosylglycinamide formyltransferase [Roseofilum sp. Beliz
MKTAAIDRSLVSPECDRYPQFTEPLQLGVMASGSGSNFEALLEAIAAGKLNARINALIYNNPGAKVAARAQRWGIPAILLNHRDYKKRRQEFDAAIVETLKEHRVQWVIMAGWMRIVTEIILSAFPNRVINIHPSLLPSFRGIRGIEDALESGVKITGCTVHLADLEVDTGPILVQAAVPVLPDDTPETLHARIQIQEHRILPQAIALAAQQYSAL